ncbi:hypothetical protein [Pseudomonas sp. NPDC089406]|uniref:hypothetical protein n=1 Tax=Pseudomonas sp. NPDC089406 TaxID=3364463 RepID=UPI00384D4130
MSEIIHAVIALGLYMLLDRFLKPYALRKWLGVALTLTGLIGCVAASQTRLLGLDLGLMAVFAAGLGVGLFRRRRRFEVED